MRRRLYFLIPNPPLTRRIVDELLLARVEERHIHVMAREDTSLEGLPAASMLQRSDFVHAVELGLTVGGGTGILAGLLAVTLAPEAMPLGGGTVLACAVAGAVIGAWAAGMIGTDVPNSRLRYFEDSLQQGQILLMVDTPKEGVDRIRNLIKSHHPEAEVHGVEPTIPAFP